MTEYQIKTIRQRCKTEYKHSHQVYVYKNLRCANFSYQVIAPFMWETRFSLYLPLSLELNKKIFIHERILKFG